MRKIIIPLAIALLAAVAVVLIRGCSENGTFGTYSVGNTRESTVSRNASSQDSNIRRRGESKDDYWDRMVDTQGFPIIYYGRVLDQDSKPLEGVEVRPEVQQVLGRAKRLAGVPEFVKCPPVHTDANGLFTISGYKGITLTFALHKEGYRRYGGAANYQPGFPQPGFPHGFEVNSGRPVEFKMIRSDMPPNLCVLDKQFRIAWNKGPITIDLGESVGKLTIIPSRRRDVPNKNNGFDWSVSLTASGFDLVPLASIEGNKPELRLAPTEGYTPTFIAGAKAGDAPWLSGINRIFAIKTERNRYGTMEIDVGSYDDETRTGFNVIIYLGQPGMRNIDRK